MRRDVQPDVVDDRFVPGRRMQRGAAFEQQRADLALRQSLQRGTQGAVAYVDLGSARFERPPQLRAGGRGRSAACATVCRK